MLAVSLKWRLGVVRRKPKGTEGRLLWGAEGATEGRFLSTLGACLLACFCLVAWGVSVASPLGPRIWVSSLGTCQCISLHPSLEPHRPAFWIPSSFSTPAPFVWSPGGLFLFLVLLPALMAVLVSLPLSLSCLPTHALCYPHCLCSRVPFKVSFCVFTFLSFSSPPLMGCHPTELFFPP